MVLATVLHVRREEELETDHLSPFLLHRVPISDVIEGKDGRFRETLLGKQEKPNTEQNTKY